MRVAATNHRDAFISHSSKDKQVADAVCATLEARGMRCWVAPRDIPPGANWGEAILDGLDACRVFVLVLSRQANASPQVMREVERAVNRGMPIIPLRVEDVMPSRSLEYFLSASHWLDAFPPPLRQHLGPLCERVHALVSADAPAPQPHRPSRSVPGGGAPISARTLLIGIGVIGLLIGLPLAASLGRRPHGGAAAVNPPGTAESDPNATRAGGGEEPSWLGLAFASVPAVVAEHVGAGAGAVGIAEVYPGGPASQAGLMPDDVVVSLDGTPLRSLKDVEAMKLPELPVGGSHEMRVQRGGRTVDVRLTVARQPAGFRDDAVSRRLLFQTRHAEPAGNVLHLESQGGFLAAVRVVDREPKLFAYRQAEKSDTLQPLWDRPARGAALASGGDRIVVAGPGGALLLCDTATGETIRHFDTADDTLFADVNLYRNCQVSPAGDTAATLTFQKTDAILTTWDVSTGRRRSRRNLSTIAKQADRGFTIGLFADDQISIDLGPFSPSGRYISTSDGDQITIWDVGSGTPVWSWKPKDRASAWALSPSWALCAVGCKSGVIEVVSVATGQTVSRLLGHSAGPDCIAWHGETVLGSASQDDQTCRIWRLPDARQTWEYRMSEAPHSFFIGPRTLVFDESRPRVWTGVTRLRELALPACDEQAWRIGKPAAEEKDFIRASGPR